MLAILIVALSPSMPVMVAYTVLILATSRYIHYASIKQLPVVLQSKCLPRCLALWQKSLLWRGGATRLAGISLTLHPRFVVRRDFESLQLPLYSPRRPSTDRSASRKPDSRRTRHHSSRPPLRQPPPLACFGKVATQKTSSTGGNLVRHHQIVARPSRSFNEPRASRIATSSLWSRSRNMIRRDCPKLRDPLLRSKGMLFERQIRAF